MDEFHLHLGWRRALPVFVAVVAIHALSVIKMPGDSAWTLHTAMSILDEGNVDLTEYPQAYEQRETYRLVEVGGRIYNRFPLGPSLWALPIVAVVDGGMRLFAGRSYRTELLTGAISDVQEFCASLAVAIASLILWRLLLALGLSRRRGLLLVLLFAFGTSAWSTASRALWQHGPSLVWLALALWSLVRAEQGRRLLWLAGLALALSYVTRPTNALSVIGLGAYGIWRWRWRASGLVAAAGAALLLFAWHNLSVFGAVLPPYFQPGRLLGTSTFDTALSGNLISPGRGLFVFTPVLLFAIRGWWLWQGDPRRQALVNVITAIIVGHWIAISLFPHWWGGWCYGPRFFSDMLVYFMVLLVPVARELDWRMPARRWYGGAFATMAVFGVIVHWAGANLEATSEWHGVPADLDSHPERLWDWSDPQFLRWRKPEAIEPDLSPPE